MNPDLRKLAKRPFDLLVAIEDQLKSLRADQSGGALNYWTGLSYKVGSRWLTSPRQDVREVIVVPALTRVPGARPWLLGVANVRGAILPICDLNQLMGGERIAPGPESRILVYNSSRLPAGFLVDEVAGYRDFSTTEQAPALSAKAPESVRRSLLGGFVQAQQEWLVLSLHKLAADEAFVRAGW